MEENKGIQDQIKDQRDYSHLTYEQVKEYIEDITYGKSTKKQRYKREPLEKDQDGKSHI